MSFVYQEPDIVTDVSTIKQNMITYLEAYMPAGWNLRPGSLADLILEANAIQHAQTADVAQQKLISDFRYFGSLVNLPPIDAVPPTATATFTVQDTAGYTIPAGSAVGLPDASGNLQGFDLDADLVIAPSSTTGTATVTAETDGTAANGLSGSAQLIQCPSFVTGCSLSTSSGGIDAELDPVYLGRLVETLATLSPIPVLGTNYAVLARSIAGVYRAVGVDGLKPGSPYDTTAEATGQDKNVTVAVADINGQPVGSTIRGQAQTYLQSLREQNFKVWVVDPQYSDIDVIAGVYSWPGFDTAAVQADVEAAIQSALSSALFATDPSGNAARWANDPVVRASVLYEAIMNVQGVRYVNQLLFGIHGASYLSAPTGLAGAASSGGSFTTGTKYAKVTAVNAAGETVGSTEASVAVTSGQKVTWSWTAVAGAVSYNVYRASSSGGESTTPALVGNASGTSLVDSGAAPSAGVVPASNTAEILGTTDVTMGAGSAIPALPVANTINVTVTASTS